MCDPLAIVILIFLFRRGPTVSIDFLISAKKTWRKYLCEPLATDEHNSLCHSQLHRLCVEWIVSFHFQEYSIILPISGLFDSEETTVVTMAGE